MNTENQEVIDQICDYAETNQIKEMLQEYLKRIILSRPADPVSFLIKSILEDPYVQPETQDEA
ncbi:hypothetical protein EON65_03425 [archaeon]|nr:MAG: hypothetical protein EON65_03425 [archaeon]